MGSRRKRKANRSEVAAAGVSRQARDNDAAGTGLARPAVTRSSGAHRALSLSAEEVEPGGAATPSTARAHDSGKFPKVSDTGKHPRIVPVTKQSEDGSYELVYEAVEPEAQEEVEAPLPAPIWRRKAPLIGGGIVAVVVIFGGLIAGAISLLSDDRPRRVSSAQKAGADQGEGDEDAPRYKYVAPRTNEGRLNDLDEEGEGAVAARQGGAANLNDTLGVGSDGLGAENGALGNGNDALGNGNGAPGDNAPVDPNGAFAPSALNANPPQLDVNDFNRLPQLDLKPNFPSIAPSLNQPINDEAREQLEKHLSDRGGPGEPEGEDNEEEEDDTQEEEDEQAEKEDEEEPEGDDDDDDNDDGTQ